MIATGFVHDLIDKKQTLKEFALSCARGQGMSIENLENKQSSVAHYEQSLRESEEELQRLSALSGGEKREWGIRQIENTIEHLEKARDEEASKLAICCDMMSRIQAWQAPGELEPLKQFMLQIIREDVEHNKDREDNWWDHAIARTRAKDPVALVDENIDVLRNRIGGYTDELRKATSRQKRIKESLALLLALPE